MRHSLCLNGEWDFMPLNDQPQCRTLPEKIVFEAQKIQVPSSWRRTYEQANGKRFGEIPEYGFMPMDIFGYPKEWDTAEAGVLHRNFRVPEKMAGQRIVLRLDGIMQKAVIYLDRKEIAVWEDGYLPLRLDITSSVLAGREHELHVVCGSFDKVKLPSGTQKTTGLVGSWFGGVCRGIWQDVYLESYPLLALEDVAFRTSVREGRLEARVIVGAAEWANVRADGPLRVRLKVREEGVRRRDVNERGVLKTEVGCFAKNSGTTDPKAAGDLPMEATESSKLRPEVMPVLAFEQPVESIPPGEVEWLRLCENERGGEVYQSFITLDWKDAKLWSPDFPFLYRAELELLAGEQFIDRREEVFGFREFWCEGSEFRLNGIPVKLHGDSWHFQGGIQQTEAYVRNWYRMCRSVGVNSIRLHAEPYPADYVRIADEEGMLIVDETAIYGSSKSMLADHPAFLENCRMHVRRLVQRDKNHPSVIMWSLQNEMRWVDGRNGYKEHIPELMTAIRELDASRPIIAEGDNRLVSKARTEVESRHYNIDGTIDQWDRSVPLTFGEHGGWWYICPQNSSMYVGLRAYRDTDESTAGLAQKERLFVEYARRHGVSGISTFNFAHYFMRAMPDRDVILPLMEPGVPGVKPKVIPAYSLTINNGLLPEGYPPYRPNPAFSVMAEAFKPATIIAAEYNRCFYDDAPITRSFDIYNDTLSAQEVTVECVIRQEEGVIQKQTFTFRQGPAERKTVWLAWIPQPVIAEGSAELTATLYHGSKRMHELRLTYRLMAASLLREPVKIGRPTVYWGTETDYEVIRRLVPDCGWVDRERLADLSTDHLLVIGSYTEDTDGSLEAELKAFVARGGWLLLLEQNQLSLGKLTLSRRPFLRAHVGDYSHPVLNGLGEDDLMFWHEELREDGPVPIIHAAFEKPALGDFTLLLECSAGDFGDGGDLWSPLLEYRSGGGMFLANQLDMMAHIDHVPQACLLLRNLLAYAGRTEELPIGAGEVFVVDDEARRAAGAEGLVAARAKALGTAALVQSGGAAASFLGRLLLRHVALDGAAALEDFGLLVAEASMLEAPGAAEAVRRYAEAGGRVLVLPAEAPQQAALARLLDRPVRVLPHETYHLAADYAHAAVRGVSPVDLFGFDKVFLSPRDAVNRVLATHRLEVPGAYALCTSVEGTAWKDYFVHGYTAEYSRLALVELNRRKARPAGAFLVQLKAGAGSILCSQLLPEPASDKALRLYTRLLANLGADFDDGLLESEKGDGEWAAPAMMALPCPPHVDFDAMKAYYIDPEFSLNNLGEGLYGWMQKKERRPGDGKLHIANAGHDPWFFSCFVGVPEGTGAEGHIRRGRLRIHADATYEVYLNGKLVPEPEKELTLAAGINRLIAIVRGTGENLNLGLVFLHPDGAYMKDLEYRLTLDEVEPK
ncbi:glycoside hydrolase family 2 TIM barrel-domain containing protein [Paenibacillus puldeungensis]|uniref:Glycoside hydrolase family 2 TIM barrel-domain containing protein n=1 Tax=Paenibacillus puldeungensis TaxID=696536 RepID=A0ABW3RXD5_9BACL